MVERARARCARRSASRARRGASPTMALDARWRERPATRGDERDATGASRWAVRAGVWLVRAARDDVAHARVARRRAARAARRASTPIDLRALAWPDASAALASPRRGRRRPDQRAPRRRDHRADRASRSAIATVRGSTSRGAARALLGLDARDRRRPRARDHARRAARSGANRSRRARSVVAQRTGAPIVADRRAARRARGGSRAGTGFMIPKPFARVTSPTATLIVVDAPTPREAAEQAPRLAGACSTRCARSACRDARGFVERVWYGDDASRSRGARAAGAGASACSAASSARAACCTTRGWLPSHEPPIPAVSVGNLTVGGTGKTPIAAWIARELARARRAAGDRAARLRRRRAARSRAAQSRTFR